MDKKVFGRAGDVTAVPHVRGDDGYFMLLVAPPDQAAGAWKRELLPEGDPLDLILVADTSGSKEPSTCPVPTSRRNPGASTHRRTRCGPRVPSGLARLPDPSASKIGMPVNLCQRRKS